MSICFPKIFCSTDCESFARQTEILFTSVCIAKQILDTFDSCSQYGRIAGSGMHIPLFAFAEIPSYTPGTTPGDPFMLDVNVLMGVNTTAQVS